MLKRIRDWFRGLSTKPGTMDEAAFQAWDEAKSRFMSRVLGEEHGMVMHAVIPFMIGGGLDLYYYPHGIPGTAIATKELVEQPGIGPSNRAYTAYELVMFTRHPLNLDHVKDPDTLFGKAHKTINAVLNPMALYAQQATLNPNDTSEFPDGYGELSGRCFLFDAYSPADDSRRAKVGLMLIMEIFRSEMAFAREQGGDALIAKLRSAGHYPYSEMERDPVA